MKVRVGSLYVDEARDIQRHVEVEMTDADAKILLKDKWDEASFSKRFEVLSALADISMHQYASERGLRSPETARKDIQNLMEKYLT